MITQADTLRSEIRTLEIQLHHAVLYQDAFSQMNLKNQLDDTKSTLINIM